MDKDEFRRWSHFAADWGADYRESLADRPVRPNVAPGDTLRQIAPRPPEQGEPMDGILADFERIIVPGMTHWQHPRFFAYFPANAAPASVIADTLATSMAAQCMLWQTSPAATELETAMVGWMRQALGLPEAFSGTIQDSASTATLAAVLVMREKALAFSGNKAGLSGQNRLRIYCSSEVHTSVDRAIWIAGIGSDNLVRIPAGGPSRAMDLAALAEAIRQDRAAGFLPAGVIACVGGTSTGSCDDIAGTIRVAHAEGLMVHVDAAWAGSAMICPEYRTLWTGIEEADSIVFNPHKWLGAQFECSIQFIRNPDDLVATLAIQPEYLKTHGKDGIINYSEWSIPLGRRFRALKLWFLLRHHGLEGLRTMIRNHVAWAHKVCAALRAEADFEIVTEPVLSLFSFRHKTAGNIDEHQIALVNAINNDGTIYLTQTRVKGSIALRFQAGSVAMTEADADIAIATILRLARDLPA